MKSELRLWDVSASWIESRSSTSILLFAWGRIDGTKSVRLCPSGIVHDELGRQHQLTNASVKRSVGAVPSIATGRPLGATQVRLRTRATFQRVKAFKGVPLEPGFGLWASDGDRVARG